MTCKNRLPCVVGDVKQCTIHSITVAWRRLARMWRHVWVVLHCNLFFVLGGGAIAPLPPQMAPLILAHDFPVLDFYNLNICYCFMKCDYFNVKDDIVAYVVHLCCILPPKPRFRGHSVNTLNIDAASVSATLVLLSGTVYQLPCSLSQSPQHSVGI